MCQHQSLKEKRRLLVTSITVTMLATTRKLAASASCTHGSQAKTAPAAARLPFPF